MAQIFVSFPYIRLHDTTGEDEIVFQARPNGTTKSI